jgi:hypothetical protein
MVGTITQTRWRPAARALVVGGLLVATCPAADVAAAAPPLDTFGGPLGFGVDALPPDDDASSDPIDLTAAFPDGLNLYGAVQTEAFVNSNGNVSFGSPVPVFEATPFPSALAPSIAIWQGDVDTTGVGADNGISWAQPRSGRSRRGSPG